MIKVLVVEDDQVDARAHQLYVQRVPNFEVVGVARSGAEALQFCQRNSVDVLLLDFGLPDINGLAVCRALRAAGNTMDVIAVTAQKDRAAIHAAQTLGIHGYLLKPFGCDDMRHMLNKFAQYWHSAPRSGQVTNQTEVDDMFRKLNLGPLTLPKGLDGETLRAITHALLAAPDGLSAAEAATAIGVTSPTARKYLDYLVDKGFAHRQPRHGRIGRPEIIYHHVT
jgi:response regulator of citrate/malate metabolism